MDIIKKVFLQLLATETINYFISIIWFNVLFAIFFLTEVAETGIYRANSIK